jgi:integrase
LGAKSKHTYDTDEANLRNHVPDAMKTKPIGAITSSNLNTLYSKMFQTHARSTVLRFRDTLVACCKWAVGNKILTSNIAEASKVPEGNGEDIPPVRPLSVEQLAGLLASARIISPVYADLIELLSLTGLRWGEVVELRVSDVQTVVRPEIRVSRSKSSGYNIKVTKSRLARTVPLTRRTWEIVEAQMAGKQSGALLFTGARGAHPNSTYFRRKLDWSAISFGHRIHDLRHTAATNWLRKGCPLRPSRYGWVTQPPP